MYRLSPLANHLEVLLVHPGGPFWQKKDAGSWMIPKGLVEGGEELLSAAKREFTEETGISPQEPFIPLGEVRHKSGKIVHAWAFCGNCDLTKIKSNMFDLEWPPKSGQMKQFPEIDRAEFFDMNRVGEKILPVEEPFVRRLAEKFPRENKPQESKLATSQTLLEF